MAKDTKQRILLTALKMFSEKGYESTNIRELTASLGLAKSSIYRHFSSKEELFNCMLDYVEDYYSKGFKTTGDVQNPPNSLEELKKLTLSLVDFTIHDEDIITTRRLLMIEQFRNERVKRAATNHFLSGLEKSFSEIFGYMISKRLLKNYDPETLALAYTTPISVLIQLCDREPEKEKEIIKKINDFVDLFIETYGIKQ